MNYGVTISSNLESRMEGALETFVQTMVDKLEKNKHKDALVPPDTPRLVRLLMGEIGEVYEQLLRDEADANMIRELADVANFCFLIARRIEQEVQQRKAGADAQRV